MARAVSSLGYVCITETETETERERERERDCHCRTATVASNAMQPTERERERSPLSHGDSAHTHTHTHTHRSQLSHGDSGIERYAALALGNLAMDPSGRTCIYESGDTLQQLARLTSSHDTEVCVCMSSAGHK
jgi:hypothetical protein